MLDEFKKYVNDPDSIPKEYIMNGYNYVENYCKENNEKMSDFIKNKENIPKIVKAIHSELPFKIRLFLSEKKINELITTHYEWLKDVFKELSKENKNNKKSKTL